MKIIFLLLAFPLVFGLSSNRTLAQQSAAKINSYNVGENLDYEVKFSKTVFRGIGIADINFTVERLTGNKNYSIKAVAKSKGTLASLFGADFNIDFQSIVDGERLHILKTVKRDEQGNRVRLSEAVFDYQSKKVIYSESDPNDVARAPRRVASPIEPDTHDLISSLFALRRLPLAVGKTFDLQVSDSGLVYKIPVRVAARELQKSAVGKIWCFRVEPEIFGAKRLIEKEGSMILWITDDARRLPVRAQINYSIGRIEIKIKKIK